MTEEALRIVETFSIGSRAREGDRPLAADPPPEFLARLNIVLNGLEISINLSASPMPESGLVTDAVQSKLWQLLSWIRESAELAYSRDVNLVDLDRRILLLLRTVGPLVPADISGAVGPDKAQVSRSRRALWSACRPSAELDKSRPRPR